MTIDFSTRYLGLELRTPIIASASPLTGNIDSLQRLEEMGAGAAVLPSLFAEQIEHEEMAVNDFYNQLGESFVESTSFFPEMDFYNAGRGHYLHQLEDAKRVLSMPVIASLNCRTSGQWMNEAARIEAAGADALELNIYDVVTDPHKTAFDVESSQLEIVQAIRERISIPFAVKIGPYYTALPNFAREVVQAGANGLVLFNRYLEPELNLREMAVQPHLELSRPSEMRLPLRWIAILYGLNRASLAATSGVHSASDAIKMILAGADAVMMASSLLQLGVEHLESVLITMKQWMEEQEYESIQQMRGSMSRQNSPDPAGFERANYIRALTSYT